MSVPHLCPSLMQLRQVPAIARERERQSQAEDARSGISRRLIEAQEQERTRIARELHDDTVQRLAFLAIEIDRLKNDVPGLADGSVCGRLDGLMKETVKISSDIQALSHQLHSATLEVLGLVEGISSFCEEFGTRRGTEVEFRSLDLPDSPLSTKTSLHLYRVLQEALNNASKYSGVRHFEVELWGTPGEIHLTISDSGVGFNVGRAMNGRGLGLTSMRERMKLLNGELSIQSRPKSGTTVHARVPLTSDSYSA